MTDNGANPTAKKKTLSAQAIVSIIIICLLIILPTGVYLWKQNEIKKLKKENESAILAVSQQANDAITNNNKKNIETITRVLSWAVRSEIMRNNLEQANTYITDIVKAADCNEITLIKEDGIVIISTNKKYEGNIYPGPVTSELNSINNVISKSDENNNIMALCPVMGLDNRIGTIVVTYTPKENVFNYSKTNE